MGSARRRCQGAESGRGDSGGSAAILAKLGSTRRFACEAGHVGIAGSRLSRSRIARVGWGRHTCRSSRADMGVARSARSTRRVRRRVFCTPSDVGIAATAGSAGPRSSCAELGRPRSSGAVMGRATGCAVCACASRIAACRAPTSVGTARRTICACHPHGAVLEPARSGMEPTRAGGVRAGGVCAGGASLHGLGCTAICGGATADRRTILGRPRSCPRVGCAEDRRACRSRGAVMVGAGYSPG
jgi:hypothetical protein